MKKIPQILESILLLSLIWMLTYHYDPYSSTPKFQLNNEIFFDSYRVIVDILIWTGLILRVFRLLKRGFDPIQSKIHKTDLVIFIGYTILVLPDVLLFAEWYYFGFIFGIAFLFLLSPWLFWFKELYLSLSDISSQKKVKLIGITILGIITAVGITWGYLYSIKWEFEKEQSIEIKTEKKTHPNTLYI